VNIDNITDIDVKKREIKMSNGQICETSTREGNQKPVESFDKKRHYKRHIRDFLALTIC